MFDLKYLNQSVMRDETIVCDWDGVIQLIDYKWGQKIYNEREYFKDFFDIDKLITDGQYDKEKIRNREIYDIKTWLAKPNVELTKEAYDKYMNLYLGDNDYYKDLPFLIMAKSLKELSEQKFVKKIVFLSHAPINVETDHRKLPIAEKIFNVGKKGSKFELAVIHGNMLKSEFINKYYPNYTAFIDDRSDIIREVIKNTDSESKSFILPFFYYNKELGLDREYIIKCQRKGITISTYSNDIIG